MRNLTVSLLVGLILSVGFYDPAITLAASDQPSVAQSKPTEDVPLPIYTPPKKLTPRARVGGGLRGTDGKELEIVALVPDHVGMTVKQAPSLNWFLSKPTSLPIRFTLTDIRSVRPLYEGPIPTPREVGVQSLNLKDLGLTLEPDVQYRWYISAVLDPNSPSKDIVTGGMIERCEFSDCIVIRKPDLSCDQNSVSWNAAQGLWYDAMACLCDLINSRPSDQGLRRQRAHLLNQIGLTEVAKWDLRSIQAPVR
jgi:hypothetical protein